MVTLEQIKLLETKVAKAIDIVTRITGENTYLKGKLETYQKRIDELEVLIRRFKEEQSRIEDGILAALDRLNQFEADMENSIAPITQEAAPHDEPVPPSASKPVEKPLPKSGKSKAAESKVTESVPETSGPLMFNVPEENNASEEDNDPVEDNDSAGDDDSVGDADSAEGEVSDDAPESDAGEVGVSDPARSDLFAGGGSEEDSVGEDSSKEDDATLQKDSGSGAAELDIF
jgi:hypothetical protein